MEIKFENTLDDYVKLGLFMLKNSKSHNSTINKARLVGTGVFSITALVYGIILFWTSAGRELNPTILICTILFVILAILNYVTYPRLMNNRTRKLLVKQAKELGDEYACRKIAKINEKEIIVEKLNATINYSLKSVVKVEVEDGYIYIMFKELKVLVIPCSAFGSEEEKNRFIKLIN